MRKLWALLFLAVPVGGVGLFWMSPRVQIASRLNPGEIQSWWFPGNVSTFGGEIDHLFNVILWITGITFVVTEGLLVYLLFRYAGEERGGKATYTHGSHKLEVAWTAVPAVILLFIALYQIPTWRKVKFRSNFPGGEAAAARPFARVVAGQFEWRVTYPGADGKLDTADDLRLLNELHVPKGESVVIRLESRDVLHSFFLPHLRVKQDAVPGMSIPVWFNAVKADTFDLVCAELCGWGHYKMRGRLVVHEPADYGAWLESARAEQERAQ